MGAHIDINGILITKLSAGKDWHMDSDYGQASLEVGGAYLTTVAIDCLLALVSAFEKLTDIAVDGTPLTPKQQGMSPCSFILVDGRPRACWQRGVAAGKLPACLFCSNFLIDDLCSARTQYHCAGPRIPVTIEACSVTLTACWRSALRTLSQYLTYSSGEELILHLLRVSGLQPSASANHGM